MTDPIKIDIISDVVCPWCAIGYFQLEQAMAALELSAEIRWLPFELNPQMPPEGENLTEHVARKYGSTPEQSARSRQQLVALGEELGLEFHYDEHSRIYNTFDAHQMILWAGLQGQARAMKLGLFKAYFSEGRNVSDKRVLIDVAASLGFDREEAKRLLETQAFADTVKEEEQAWRDRGITGVPAMIFEGRYLIPGAQGAENYANILQQVLAKREEAAG